MRRHRSGLVVIALATLSVQVATAALSAIGLCCPVDRTHAEHRPAASCPMHAAQPSIDPHAGHRAGHDGGSSQSEKAPAVAPATDGRHLTCDCAAAAHLAIGAPGLVPASPSLVVVIEVVGSVEASREALLGRRASPIAPPPRTPVSLPS